MAYTHLWGIVKPMPRKAQVKAYPKVHRASQHRLPYLDMQALLLLLESGITWTGLSYDLAVRYNDPLFMSMLQAI